MKTLCVIAVVLSLASLCQSVSLACPNLIKPVEKSPDVSGSWYVIAISSSQCLFTTLINAFVSLSFKAIYTPTGIPNVHNAFYHFKVYGLCANESERSLVYGGSIYDVDSSNALKGKPEMILQTGCSDCMVVKSDDDLPLLILLSRRQTVSDAELNEFKTQAECLKWAKPVVLSTDHDYVNCKEFNTDNDFDASGIGQLIFERLSLNYQEPLQCIVDTVLYYPRLLIENIINQFRNA